MSIELIPFAVIVLLLLLVIMIQDRGLRREQEDVKQMNGMVRESHALLEKSLDARDAERQEWVAERQQLLDRIQAPSFAEFKQAEIKTTKLQQGIKDPPPLEPL